MSSLPRVLSLWIKPWRTGSSNVCSVGKPSSTNTTSKSISVSTAVRQNNIKTVTLTHQFAIHSNCNPHLSCGMEITPNFTENKAK